MCKLEYSSYESLLDLPQIFLSQSKLSMLFWFREKRYMEYRFV